MPLLPGKYEIYGEPTGFGNPVSRPIGRSPIEDHSLNPKNIFRLIPSPVPLRPKTIWDVIRPHDSPPNVFILSANGAPTTVSDIDSGDLNIVALLRQDGYLAPTHWTIIEVENNGYKIFAGNRQVWGIGDHSLNGDFITLQNDAGHYDPGQIFRFQRLAGSFESTSSEFEKGYRYAQREQEYEAGMEKQRPYEYGKREKMFCS